MASLGLNELITSTPGLSLDCEPYSISNHSHIIVTCIDMLYLDVHGYI